MSKLDEVIKELIDSEEKSAALKPITVRLPPDLMAEIRKVCDKEDIFVSVLLRRVIEIGWDTINGKNPT